MLTIPHRDHTIFLRPWLETDIPSLVRHANNPNVACNMTDSFPHPYTEDNGKQFFERVKSAVPANVLAIVVDGEACGSIGIFPQSDINRLNGEFGYWLSEQYWNKGIATETVKAMVRYVLKTFRCSAFSHARLNITSARKKCWRKLVLNLRRGYLSHL